MYVETKMTGRQRRIAQGLCEQCSAERDDTVSTRLCERCLSKHRERNRAYEGRNIAAGKQISIRQRRQHEMLIREYRYAKMIKFAKEAGRLPSLAECARMFDLFPSTALAEARRAAFRTRKKNTNEVRMVIPYPVPEEWQA